MHNNFHVNFPHVYPSFFCIKSIKLFYSVLFPCNQPHNCYVQIFAVAMNLWMNLKRSCFHSEWQIPSNWIHMSTSSELLGSEETRWVCASKFSSLSVDAKSSQFWISIHSGVLKKTMNRLYMNSIAC